MSDTSVATAAAATAPLPTGTWRVDPIHSSVEFHVKHLGIATVKGQFKEFEGTLEIDDAGARAYGTVEVASIDTREPQRDDHLRSADFFEVESFPQITFRSTAIRPLDNDEFEIDADLTIHGVTNRLTLKAVFEGAETDPQGNDRVGVSASAQISHGDYGMKFNAALGSGNVVVSDKVKILVDVSAVRQA
ncbi:MAG TPA: YceI family protein [Solirubrobacteraceae bacterium]|jgi:polyisoprenoid-binding protein YceI|nr:YceI family protein [Solirubrobacteraceae bacterium]